MVASLLVYDLVLYWHQWKLLIAQEVLYSRIFLFLICKMFFKLRTNGSIKNISVKGSLGNLKWIYISVRTSFWNVYF